MRSSFNAFGKFALNGGGHTPIWLGTVSPLAIGGTLDRNYLAKGALYPAGTPVYLADKVITPVIAVEVTNAADGVLTIDAREFGGIALDTTWKVATIGADGKVGIAAASAITAIAVNASDSNLIDVTTAATAEAGASVALVPAAASADVTPNGYLYNDIWLGDIDVTDESAGATGAVVNHHPEGILIDRTPARGIAAAMAAAVPYVQQING